MSMISQWVIIVAVFFGATSCQDSNSQPVDEKPGPAVVNNVTVTGTDGQYTFSVTIKSPDTGCDQYADWWEVISADGNTLHYRRILAHSHVGEQPFSRSGGPVRIDVDTEVIIRGHMNNSGYGEGEIGFKGSVAKGFQPLTMAAGFGNDLENIAPQPTDCAF